MPLCLLVFCLVFTLAGTACAEPDAPPSEEYDLNSAVIRALEQNFSVASARAGAESAESLRKAQRGAFGPALGSDYGYVRRQRATSISGNDQDKSLYSWNIWLRQNVFAGFATLNRYQRSVLEKENADANLDRARLALIGTVQEHFLLLLQARENTRSAKDSYERLRSQLGVTKAFYEVGLKPRLDVLQAEVDAATAENILLQATNAYETQVTRLNTLLVLPPDLPIRYTGDLVYLPFSASLEQCLNSAYAKRPDLRMAQKSVGIAEKDVGIARSGYYPSVDAEGGWGTQGDSPAASGSNTYPSRYNSWNVGVNASWTAFQWGTTYYSEQGAKQTVLRLKADENALRQEIAFEVRSRLLKLSEAAKRIKVAQKGLEQAKEAYRLAGARYQEQAGIFSDVLDAQAKLTSAEVALTGAHVDYLTTLSQLYTAMGEEMPSLALR